MRNMSEIEKVYEEMYCQNENKLKDLVYDISTNYTIVQMIQDRKKFMNELYYSCYKCIKNLIFDNLKEIKEKYKINGQDVYNFPYSEFKEITKYVFIFFKLANFLDEHTLRATYAILDFVANKTFPSDFFAFCLKNNICIEDMHECEFYSLDSPEIKEFDKLYKLDDCYVKLYFKED